MCDERSNCALLIWWHWKQTAICVATLRTEISWGDCGLLAFFKREGFVPARLLCLDCMLDPTRIE